MDATIQCSCGTVVQRPEGDVSQYCCPRCQQPLREPAAAPHAPPRASHAPVGPPPVPPADSPPPVTMPTPHPAAGKDLGAMCPICQATLQSGESCVHCPACQQVHHVECWREVGGCAVYGCSQAPALNKSAPPEQPLSAWGDNKNCPVCGEKIKSIAVKCRYCGAEFNTVDPLTARDLRSRIQRDQSLKSVRSFATGLFICSIVGLLAPLILIIALCWVLPKRKELHRAGPVYLVLGYCALGLSVLYTLLWIIFIASS